MLYTMPYTSNGSATRASVSLATQFRTSSTRTWVRVRCGRERAVGGLVGGRADVGCVAEHAGGAPRCHGSKGVSHKDGTEAARVLACAC